MVVNTDPTSPVAGLTACPNVRAVTVSRPGEKTTWSPGVRVPLASRSRLTRMVVALRVANGVPATRAASAYTVVGTARSSRGSSRSRAAGRRGERMLPPAWGRVRGARSGAACWSGNDRERRGGRPEGGGGRGRGGAGGGAGGPRGGTP